ncbi:hypothetical protein [Rhodococcus koreensis]|uniref:hypothetical protein n=1 Tax=Rhodococcus koreensis TaxID=99653 RepID=UPI00197DBEC8|nr:hypothetical protein [Rhodococcus koreensis]QSE86312.1 hypothetical protein JWS14_45735 [Rhodococcus koreensis]
MSVRRFLAVVVILGALVAILVYACRPTQQDPQTSPLETSLPAAAAPPAATAPITTFAPVPPPTTAAPAPDADVAEDVARQALSVAFTWYPATDQSPNDGFVRARQWLTDRLAAQVAIPVTPERGPGVQWGRWATTNAKVVADVLIGCSGCPPDTDTLIHRVATIHQTAITGDNAVPVDPNTIVWVTLSKTGGNWLIDTIRY